MESYKSDVDHVTYNGILDASSSSTPADMPSGGRSTESRDGSGERTTEVVNTNMQTIVPVRSPHFTKVNEGELGEDGIDGQDLTASNIGFDQALFEHYEHVHGGFRVGAPYPNVILYKYEAANSTSFESKECCCICLDEYRDSEEIAKIDCGHLYHAGCIEEWIKLKNTCPICKRRVCFSYEDLRIHAFLAHKAAANQFLIRRHRSVVLTELKRVKRNLINKEQFSV